jgi:hypothetical protein
VRSMSWRVVLTCMIITGFLIMIGLRLTNLTAKYGRISSLDTLNPKAFGPEWVVVKPEKSPRNSTLLNNSKRFVSRWPENATKCKSDFFSVLRRYI